MKRLRVGWPGTGQPTINLTFTLTPSELRVLSMAFGPPCHIDGWPARFHLFRRRKR